MESKEAIENELINLIFKYRLPDPDKYSSSSYYFHTNNSIFLNNDDIIFYFLKFEDNNKNRSWKLTRIYKDVTFNDEDLYLKVLKKTISILKSIFENPQSIQHKNQLTHPCIGVKQNKKT